MRIGGRRQGFLELVQQVQEGFIGSGVESELRLIMAINQESLFDVTDWHRTSMTGFHTGDNLLAEVVLPSSVQLAGVDHVVDRRTMIDLKPYGDARVLLVSEPAVPIVELVPVIHGGGTEIKQGDTS